MVNNFEIIKNYLTFRDENDFYFLQIFKRRKDNPGMEKDMYVVTNYYVYSIEHLEKLKNDIISICDSTNSRAYIRLNVRNNRQVAFRCLNKLATLLTENKFRDVKAMYDASCGEVHDQKPKRWIVDIDTKDLEFVNQVGTFISELQNGLNYNIEGLLESKNGYHIITQPFNTKLFNEKFPSLDIQKDNPTILYAP